MDKQIISVVSDVVCPWCYIGKHRLAKGLEILSREIPEVRSAIAIEWLPFQLNPAIPVEGMDRSEYCRMKFGSLEYANKLYENVAANARADGLPIELDKISVTPNTRMAHRLIYFASIHGVGDAAVDELFEAYFVSGMDIGKPETLAALAPRFGLDTGSTLKFLMSNDRADELQTLIDRAYESGIQGVPAFLWNGKWLLTGAQSPETIAQVIRQQLEKHSEIVS